MENESLKQLFQQEFAKMVAVISKLYGLQHIETAEDIVSETFLQAAETWGMKGIPENPAAWLYAVAKQKTLHFFRRNKIFEEKVIPELTRGTGDETAELNFSQENIKDSQLQMLFAVCNPAIASEAQIGLALRILCGFGVGEIAEAFLSNKETIGKRLFRAKEKLRTEKIKMEIPHENEMVNRLDNVLHIIYLLFSEGYYSKTQNQVLQKELCLEAIRLGVMLTGFEKTNLPKTNALMALMCFHASRFNARLADDTSNRIILYEEQNEELWDAGLIRQGMYFLNLSAQGDEISSYHLEARIASWHCQKEDTPEKWHDVLALYDQLLLVNYSPSVALNRIYALYKVKGYEAALPEAEKLKWEDSHFYYLLLGELYQNTDKKKAQSHFQKAFGLAKTETEKKTLQLKMEKLNISAKTS
jgi:RNA polymerase sigma-70 factor (ECF subfamily)